MNKRNTFTLIELLLIVSIMLILMSLLFPGLRSALNMSRQTACLNNLKQIGLGAMSYADNNAGGWLPVAGTSAIPNWKSEISPYIGINSDAVDIPQHAKGAFLCPSWKDPEAGLNNNNRGGYGWNYYYCGYMDNAAIVSQQRKKVSKATRPGLTIFCGDSTDWKNGGTWNYKLIYAPSTLTSSPGNTPAPPIGDRHKKGINAMFLDMHGSWNRQSTLIAGENSDCDWYFRF